MSISEWVKHTIECMGPCGKEMSYNKFRLEDMIKPRDEMEGLLACSRCHNENYVTYITQETLDDFNNQAGTNFQNGDDFRAVMFQVVSPERHAELSKKAEGDTIDGRDYVGTIEEVLK